jgi:hypothetical protein
MQSSRQPPAQTRFGQYLTRRANQRHSFIIAQSVKRPSPRNSALPCDFGQKFSPTIEVALARGVRPAETSWRDAVEETMQPIDRLFLSIAAHHDMLAPDTRVRTIYPRYLEQVSTPGPDGLTIRAFREGTPYSNEDLFLATAPSLSARCTRDAATPGMCLSDRRIDGADLTFRFPRSWLAQWRDVANAMDRLTVQLHGPT